MRRSVTRFVALVLVAGLVGAVSRGAPPQAPPPREVDIATLVGQLGSPDFRQREAAMERLSNLPLAAPPPGLLNAQQSSNPEVRRRATQAVRALRASIVERGLSRQQLFAKRGRIDRFVAGVAAWDVPADDDRVWQAMLDLAVTLSKKAALTGKAGESWPRTNGRPPLTTTWFWPGSQNPLLVRSDQPYRLPGGIQNNPIISRQGGIRAPEVIAPQTFYRNLIVAWGPVTVNYGIHESVVLANGNVKTGGSLLATIVVCDGDFDVARQVGTSVVIARGNIHVGTYVGQSVLIAGGKVTIDKPEQDMGLPQLKSVVRENDHHPLGFVTFFELAAVGVEAEAEKADGGVTITRLTADSPLTLAGIRAGDLVAKVGEHGVITPDDFRRRLRDASAIKGEAVLTVRRGDDTRTVTVDLPD